ncbi:MAG: polysaccharide biosynthesis/export family protein [Bacteroidales bacterium]|nr:polysaccharide biosynthesis/export family protein [Bacteroidales bacterium]
MFLFSTSCTSYKSTAYLQGLSENDSVTTYYLGNIYKLQKGDIIYIKIISFNRDITQLFNIEDVTSFGQINNAYIYYKGYCIDDNGEINMPIIGNVYILNKTISEVEYILKEKIKNYLTDFYINVKYGGFKITILGEVKNPGINYFYTNKVTIFEALGSAGDLTDYGNRKNILLLRQTTNGLKIFRINLLKKDLFKQPYYYIQPNDILYVEPVKTKNWRLNSYNVSIILSSISTLILVINFILRF